MWKQNKFLNVNLCIFTLMLIILYKNETILSILNPVTLHNQTYLNSWSWAQGMLRVRAWLGLVLPVMWY